MWLSGVCSSWLIGILGGLVSLLICFSSKSMIFFFFGLELKVYMALVVIFLKDGFQNKSISIVYYFIVSVISSIFLLWSMLLKNDFMFMLSFLFKLGFFPFIWWFPMVVSKMSYFSFFYLNFVQKLLPIIMMITYNNVFSKSLIFWMFFLSYLMSIFKLYQSRFYMKEFLAWSSSCKMCLFFFLGMFDWELGLTYFLMYNFIFVLFFFFLSFSGLSWYWDESFKGNHFLKYLIYFGLFVFMGMPPFLGFFFKALVFFSLSGLKMFFFGDGYLTFFLFLLFMKMVVYVVVGVNFMFLLNKKFFTKFGWISIFLLVIFIFLNCFFFLV